MDRLQRSAINMASGLLAWAAPVAATFVATPILVRRLGDGPYGLQNLAGVVVGYFSIMDFGLDLPVTKFLAEFLAAGDGVAAARLLRTTRTLFTVIGICGAVVVAASSRWLADHVFKVPPELRGEAHRVFLWSAPSFLAYSLLSWGRAAANGAQRYDLGSGLWSLMTLASAGIGVAVVIGGGGVVAFVAVRFACTAVAAATYAYALARIVPGQRSVPRFDRAIARRIKLYAWSGLALRASGFLSVGLDRTLIGAWLGVGAVTAYAIPWMLLVSVGQLLGSLTHFTFPMASALGGAEREDLRRLFLRATGFLATVATLACVPLAILGDRFLALWLGGSASPQSAPVLRLLVVAGYVQALTTMMANNIAVGSGLIGPFTVYTLSRGAVVAIGLLVLLRPLGILGAGLAMIAPLPIDLWYWRRVVVGHLGLGIGRALREAYARPAVLAVGTAVAALACRPLATTWPGFAAVVVAITSAYVVAAFAIGAFGAMERAALGHLVAVVARRFGSRGRAT